MYFMSAGNTEDLVKDELEYFILLNRSFLV